MSELKYNIYKHLLKPSTVRVAIPSRMLSQEDRAKNMERLNAYHNMWLAGDKFRRKRERMMRYVFGDQWKDLVETDSGTITEEQNILSQGKVPLKNNLMRSMIKSVLGTFRSNHTEPECISRNRDNQELGEMMTIAVQCAYQTNEVWELDARMLEELCISGVAVQTVRYRYIKEMQDYDVYVENENPARCFWNTDVSDVRGKDIRTFGMIEDLTIDEVIQRFARNRADALRLREIYKNRNIPYLQSDEALSRDNVDNLDFLRTNEPDKCRVIQAWEVESKERLLVHDPARGKLSIYEVEDEEAINAENEKRVAEAVAHGVDEQTAIDSLTMRVRWFYDTFFYVRYLSPDGDVLFEGQTPFSHKGMPFEVLFYPLIDGEVHSLAEDMIDQQRYINRLITLADFIIGTSAKGVLVFPEDALGDMTKEEVLEEWASYRGVIFAKIRPGMPLPTQISSNSSNVGLYELLNLQIKLMQDTTGIHPAMQGAQAKSGTPSSLYSMEVSNAQNNLLDMLSSFDAFRRRRDTKIMKTIQQYYDEPRYMNIAGENYREESKWYDPEKIRKSEFDLAIVESMHAPAYRANINQFLLNAMQVGAMDWKTVLKVGGYPFADRIIEALEANEQEKAMQMMAQQANPQGVQMLEQAIGLNQNTPQQ